MKRIIIILLVFTLYIPICLSQVVWKCPQIDTHEQTYDSLKTKIKLKNYQKLASALLEHFPLDDDKQIFFQYIITCNKSVNVEEVSDCLANWYKSRIPHVNPRKDGMINRLSATAILNRIGAAASYMNPTFISAEEEITIDIKEDRIRITLDIPRYISTSALFGTQNYSPGAMFPSTPNGIQKNAYGLAFIICNSTIIDDAKDILNYLNTNMNKEDIDW